MLALLSFFVACVVVIVGIGVPWCLWRLQCDSRRQALAFTFATVSLSLFHTACAVWPPPFPGFPAAFHLGRDSEFTDLHYHTQPPVGPWGLNSGPRTCATSSLSTELSPQTLTFFFFFTFILFIDIRLPTCVSTFE